MLLANLRIILVNVHCVKIVFIKPNFPNGYSAFAETKTTKHISSHQQIRIMKDKCKWYYCITLQAPWYKNSNLQTQACVCGGDFLCTFFKYASLFYLKEIQFIWIWSIIGNWQSLKCSLSIWLVTIVLGRNDAGTGCEDYKTPSRQCACMQPTRFSPKEIYTLPRQIYSAITYTRTALFMGQSTRACQKPNVQISGPLNKLRAVWAHAIRHSQTTTSASPQY